MSEKFHISIIGFGKFGQAMKSAISRGIGRGADSEKVEFRFFDPMITQENISTTLEDACFKEVKNKQKHFIIPCIPADQVTKTLEEMKSKNLLNNSNVVLVSKGVSDKGNFLYEDVSKIIDSSNISILAGPHFAQEIIDGNQTITVIGCTSKMQQDLEKLFSFIKPIFTQDCLGIDVCSVMKNISSFCTGLSHGLDLGENSKSILISRCIELTQELLELMQCNKTTIYQSPLLADLILCTTSPTSRNYKAGYEIAKHKANLENQTIESVRSAKKLQSILKQQFPNQSFALIDLVTMAIDNKNDNSKLIEKLKTIID